MDTPSRDGQESFKKCPVGDQSPKKSRSKRKRTANPFFPAPNPNPYFIPEPRQQTVENRPKFFTLLAAAPKRGRNDPLFDDAPHPHPQDASTAPISRNSKRQGKSYGQKTTF